MRAHARQPGLPVGISLRTFSRVVLSGDPEAAAAMVRAMIAQIAIFHSPDDMRICVCAPPDRIARWQWVKWLPHNLHPTEHDAAGPVRLMAPTLARLEAMLGAEFSGRPRFTPRKADCSLPYHVVGTAWMASPSWTCPGSHRPPWTARCCGCRSPAASSR